MANTHYDNPLSLHKIGHNIDFLSERRLNFYSIIIP